MALLPAKKVVRTYARQKRALHDDEPATKRRRVECAAESCATVETIPKVLQAPQMEPESTTGASDTHASSPQSSPAIWSDEAPQSSPPSSPITSSSPPPPQKRRPVFSLFKKQLKSTTTTKQLLSERNHNAQSPPRPAQSKSKRMVQMQLDLASESRKACKTCGMEYIPSNAEDAALHRKFHAMNVGGVDFTKATVERLRKNQVWSRGEGSFIVVVGRKDAVALRNRSSDVLKVVNTELGAVPISDDELWSQTRASDAASSRTNNKLVLESTKAQSTQTPVDRFKIYLYIRGHKCVGACLAERIWEAYTVLPQDHAPAQTRQLPSDTKSSSISISVATAPALLGISRIWTSTEHRKQGFATRLLDMSSGNPFRASLSYNPAASPVPQTSFTNNSVSGVPEEGRSGPEDAPPSKTKKHVRIESNTTFIPPHPVSSDTDDSPLSPVAHRLGQSGFGDSINYAYPTTSTAGDVSAGGSNTERLGRGGTMATPDIMADSARGYQTPQSYMSPSGVPANPFSRTLASMEPQQKESGNDRTPAERPALGNNRASLDVESFKNMLLTGKRPPGPPAQGATQSSIPSGPQFESSSSTDTSSISRQSLFESSYQVHPESPRTSIEVAESDEDEDMGLVSEVKKGKKKPPPAPKHRHGKLVTPRKPQTVSFDGFSASEPIPPPTTRSRDNSEVNKPLPPTPVVSPPVLHISTQDTSQQQVAAVQQTSSDTLLASDIPRPQKRTPPPVPLARRQSQLRTSTAGNRSRSNSSLTMSSQQSVEPSLPSPAPSNKDPLSTAKSPPPPPRSRHGAKLADISTSSANSSSTELPQRSTSVRTAASVQGPTSSRRSTLDSEPASPSGDLRRTSSISSNRPSHRTVSNDSTSNSMPPPPPPPRRRNRSSLDQQRPHIPSTTSPTESRRTSAEHRRTSVASESSLRREYAPIDEKGASEYALYSPNEEAEKKLVGDAALTQTESGSSNILDDMDKFQREIEELRSRYK
ncbi:hypothetical protein DE146DRAFT_633850 [Phaeosphaeria sp. MPI-PUGE-AT-0046c]|nr:hypothetical protein DE146DRAFT_633850 [Phaeosphaeria sp. MPI-PUGE-AT-0046c]